MFDAFVEFIQTDIDSYWLSLLWAEFIERDWFLEFLPADKPRTSLGLIVVLHHFHLPTQFLSKFEHAGIHLDILVVLFCSRLRVRIGCHELSAVNDRRLLATARHLAGWRTKKKNWK